ncbi:MltA domain-containing protein [Cyanobacterium stanieri LEGE 03274]|uniref:peptidoglycan lytic exotransglycosylase n=1 Tax=Cyanobacterium stanieri LEGE 03274 TaxID=1828756 RepID=A0ABR9V5S4_9CHRO|nr:MltA domain-containing protein [Cyanobacterium stanieri]MBE9223244.1 MltA domain-containing protein [Cyanobacterium stanieri LEGE 03274]
MFFNNINKKEKNQKRIVYSLNLSKLIFNLSKVSLINIGLGLFFIPSSFAQNIPLKPVESLPMEVLDTQILSRDRQRLIRAIDHSLRYMNTESARKAYENYSVPGFTRERVMASLRRFRELLATSHSSAQLQEAIEREFRFYRSVGHDGEGTVHFTGYFQPVYRASRQRTDEFRYPLYRRPNNFDSWNRPHPTRAQLEGVDGQGTDSIIQGNELVWLGDRLEAYLVQVQGSAKLRLTNGQTMTIGFNGATDYPYVSLGRELINDGKVPAEEMSLPRLMQYLENNPDELSIYLPRNNRFIFFNETGGQPPMGSLNVPVTDERSIATDKSIMPPGALALIHTRIPQLNPDGRMITPVTSLYVLDQDTGSAIRGAGRVDIFFGTGDIPKAQAGLVDWDGDLFYLLLK